MATPLDTNPGPAIAQSTNTESPRSTHQTIQTIAVTLSPAAVAADTSAEQTFSGLGTGLLPGDVILNVSKPTTQAGIGIVNSRVDTTTADKFYITFMNSTSGSVTPTASQIYLITMARFIASVSSTPGTFSSLPATVTSN